MGKHMKNVGSSQSCISMNFWTEFSKAQVFPCEYRQIYEKEKIAKHSYRDEYIWEKYEEKVYKENINIDIKILKRHKILNL